MMASSFHERDVKVALRALDLLGGLRDLDGRRFVGARRHDRGMKLVDRTCRLGR
jgi:hypothetical protein